MNNHYILQALNYEGKSVYIDDVPNGINCRCFCKECNSPLIAKQGNIKIHHFAHANGNDNIQCCQTALHLMAKEIISEEKRCPLILNESFDFVSVDNIEQEKNLGDIKPDIYAEYDGKPIAIEIFVSHAIDDVKTEKIFKHKLTTYEIDLSKSSFKNKEEVKRAIYNWENIKIIYDQNLVQSYIQHKKQFIKKLGEFKPIKNGTVYQCHMRGQVVNGVFSKWRNVSSDKCLNCFFGLKAKDDEGIYCIGHLQSNSKIPYWFLQANLNEDRFMTIKEVHERLKTFILQSRYSVL